MCDGFAFGFVLLDKLLLDCVYVFLAKNNVFGFTFV